jgi:chemotaxis protein methyltransferase CheR
VPGCATGEDAYGAALIAARFRAQVEITASDVNTEALAAAERGRYTPWSLRDVPKTDLCWFHPVDGGMLELDERVRRVVRFVRHNLLDRALEPEGGGRWDFILCRNVLIYFTSAQTSVTLAALGRALAPDGLILLGSSEIVLEAPSGLELVNVGPRLALRLRRAPRPVEPREFRVPALPSAPRVSADASRPSRPAAAPAHEPERADPTSASGLLESGIEQYLAGNVERALEALRSSLFLEPKLWPAAFYLGLCYETLGLPVQALREFRSAVTEAERAAHRPDADVGIGPLSGWAPDLKWLAHRRALALSASDPSLPARRIQPKEGS